MKSPFSESSLSVRNDNPELMGIWRVGPTLHSNERLQLTLAQPADAYENPRWGYVIKRVVNRSEQPKTKSVISQTIAVAADVQHPGLVSVLDGASTGVFPYVVMPYLRGSTMGLAMQQAEQTALPVALWLARQAAEAIAAMHASGWIHGQIEPDNVMIGGGGHVTVIDYGSAQRIGEPMGVLSAGAADYAPPEQHRPNTAASPAMDVFSLGRLLWQWMLRVQVSDESQLDAVATLVEQMIDPSAESRPTLPSVVKTLKQIELHMLSQHIGPTHQQSTRRAA